MPDIAINKTTEMATRQGYTRGADPTLEFPQPLEEDMDSVAFPDMMEIDGRLYKHEELTNVDVAAGLETLIWVEEPLDVSVEGPVVAQPIPELIIAHPIDGQESLSNRFVKVSVGRDASLPEPRRRFSSFARGRR